MTPEKEIEVRTLADKLFDRQEKVRMMSMQNTSADPEMRRKEFVAWHVAKAEEYEALEMLNKAMKP